MKKKILIIEGPDNCGKDTLINKLKENFNNPVILHAGVPPKYGSLFDYYYKGIIHDTLDAFYDDVHDAIIHNRSMYGEFVYGPKYRGKTPSEIAKMIYKLETGQLRTFILSNELYFILLTSNNVDLLVQNDDGKSISNKAADIQDEITSFDTIFNLSQIENKKRVYVNHGNVFRDRDDIYNKVVSFVKV
jgi:hypothetical protein